MREEKHAACSLSLGSLFIHNVVVQSAYLSLSVTYTCASALESVPAS
jgi:hypothetical protein